MLLESNFLNERQCSFNKRFGARQVTFLHKYVSKVIQCVCRALAIAMHHGLIIYLLKKGTCFVRAFKIGKCSQPIESIQLCIDISKTLCQNHTLFTICTLLVKVAKTPVYVAQSIENTCFQ